MKLKCLGESLAKVPCVSLPADVAFEIGKSKPRVLELEIFMNFFPKHGTISYDFRKFGGYLW